MSIISQDFYNRNTLEVAKDILGCKLNRRTESGILAKLQELQHFLNNLESPMFILFTGCITV